MTDRPFAPGDRVCLKIAPNVEGKAATDPRSGNSALWVRWDYKPDYSAFVPIDILRLVDPPEHPANKDRSLLHMDDRVTFQTENETFQSTICNPHTWLKTYESYRIIRVERQKWEDV